MAEAEQRLANATENEAKAEAALKAIKTPRSLDAQKVIADLKTFGGTEFLVSSFQDDESVQLTRAISTALHDAGWIIKQTDQGPITSSFFSLFDNGPIVAVPPCIRTGIWIDLKVSDPKAVMGATLKTATKEAKAALLLEATLMANIFPLDAKTVDPRILNRTPGSAPIGICIGKKP